MVAHHQDAVLSVERPTGKTAIALRLVLELDACLAQGHTAEHIHALLAHTVEVQPFHVGLGLLVVKPRGTRFLHAHYIGIHPIKVAPEGVAALDTLHSACIVGDDAERAVGHFTPTVQRAVVEDEAAHCKESGKGQPHHPRTAEQPHEHEYDIGRKEHREGQPQQGKAGEAVWREVGAEHRGPQEHDGDQIAPHKHAPENTQQGILRLLRHDVPKLYYI